MKSFAEKLETQGFAILENVIDDAIISELSDSLGKISLNRAVSRRGDVAFGIRELLNVVPAVRALANSARIRDVVDPIAGKDAQIIRAIFFDKTPEANWKVAWHQDLTIAVRQKKGVEGFNGWSVKASIPHTQPPDSILEHILTMRIHLDASDESNGALRVIVGSHKKGRLDAENTRKLKGAGEMVVCHVPKGGALLMRPLLLHASSAGSNPVHRRVIHLEYSADTLPGGLEWYGT
ncbi:MAG TPA: phytanoyl-CoA dioxygenase family protein [Nitrososphaera sp.]|jgi:ectoine hydroxylase-related dioxygenase (phytanoyl-CoA dioxygenase family)|nr:phytanoyl-CoA dioxygenase family protein [Nitrososphaera sp.]